MKISKRILGVALALIMIFNVFAIGTFAAFPDDTLVKLSMSAEDKSYAQGETITIKFSAQAHPELASIMIGGQYEIAYNNAIFEPATESDVLDDHNFVAIQAGYDAGISGVQTPGNATAPSELYDWNETICYQVGDDGTTFDATAGVDLFTIDLKVKADAPDGTYTIGFNPLGYSSDYCNGFVNDGLGLGGLYGQDASSMGFSVPNMYELGTLEITVGEEKQPIRHVENQIRDDANGTYDVGVKFTFSPEDIDIQFSDGTDGYVAGFSTTVDRVGADIYVNDVKVNDVFESPYVYEVNGEYQYRVIIEDRTVEDENKYTIVPYVVYSDSSLPVVYGESVDVYPSAVIAEKLQ